MVYSVKETQTPKPIYLPYETRKGRKMMKLVKKHLLMMMIEKELNHFQEENLYMKLFID